MYCGQCGSYVRDGAQFCPCCGGIMNDTSERDAAGEYTGRSTRTVVKKRRKWPFVLAFVLILVAAAAAILAFRYLQQSNAVEEDPLTEGKESYTALITAYLEESSANDRVDLLALFFPGAESYYQNADSTRSTLEILRYLDSWTSYYGYRAVSAELDDALFADLEDSSAAAVVATIAEYSGLEQISELYTVSATVGYQDGTSIDMTFEIIQCEYGCYLVAVQ